MKKYKLSINKSALSEDKPSKAEANGKGLAVVLHKNSVYALNSVCTHKGCGLEKGHIKGEELICPCHGGTFDIKSGKSNKNTPWVTDTEQYKVNVDEKTGDLFLEM